MKKHVEITNKNGFMLRGYYDSPEDFNGTCVLFFHGFTGNLTEHGGMFRDFSEMLSREGIASLRFDYSGNGESDGAFRDFTFHTLLTDADDMLRYAMGLVGVKELVLLGFSMGGALAAHMAGSSAYNIQKLILWSPSARIADMIKRRYEQARKQENGNVDCPNFELSKAMYDSAFQYDLNANVHCYCHPTLIIQGRKDLAVGYLEAYRYAGWFPHALLHIIESAGHGYDGKAEREELFKHSMAFIRGKKL